MNALVIFMIFALASPIFGEESSTESKRQEKRGIVNLGYGGHYPGALGAHSLTGYTGYGGFGGYGHGYLPSAPVYSLSHGLGQGIHHGIAAAPSLAHTYSAPLASYSHAYNHHAPSLLSAAAPWRVGYNGLHGAGYGHGLGYVNGW